MCTAAAAGFRCRADDLRKNGALGMLHAGNRVRNAMPSDGTALGLLIYIVSTVLAYGLFHAGLGSSSSELAGVLTL